VSLAAIRPGDIVQVAGSLATVREKARGRLLVAWNVSQHPRWIKAREVEAHWRKRPLPKGQHQ